MSRESVIEVENVDAGYGRTPLLEKITFSVFRGEIFAILGGSGCGKSTLMKHLIGLRPPLGGRIRILGDDVSGGSEAARARALRHFGVAYQSGALFGSMTLLENVCLPLEIFTELPRAARRLVAAMKLDLVGLREHAASFPAEISGGMRKRAAIARALALDPAILFLDEPSAGLDPVTSASIDRLILRLRETQTITFVVVTHELASIQTIADRCVMLDARARGMVAMGAPAALRDQPPNETVRAFFLREAGS